MRRGISLIVCLLCTFMATSQTTREEVQGAKISTSKAIKVGRTRPIKELVKLPSTDRNKKAIAKAKVTAAPENFIGRKGSNAVIPELEHQGYDPIRQKSKDASGRMTSIAPDINMDGLFSNFGSPNDPSGEVGLDYYVQAINATDIAVYNKSNGSLVDEFSANTLWASINESSAGDPIILFDHEFNRWIITEFTSPNGSANLLFAISLTSDPLGSYDVYTFSPPNFPDYPKWGIWRDNYFVTTNEIDPENLHQYFFDRSAFLAGESEITVQRVELPGNTNTEAGFYVTTPVSWIGDNPPKDVNPIALRINDSSWGEVQEDVIELFTFEVDLEGETSITKTSIATTPFDGYPCDNVDPTNFSCLSQGGSSQGIDGIPEVIMNLPHYRNFETHESIVLSFITDVDNGGNLAGIRWVELRRTSGDWELHQEGTYAPDDGLHRFMPSISIDKDGNIGLAYNTTSDSEFVGIKYTGRYAEDPLGTMTVNEFDVVEGTGSVSGDRFGDYAHMSIDPQDERTFWYTSEYATENGSRTRIVSFHLEDNANDLTVYSINNPETSTTLTATESVSVTVENSGTENVSNFDLILKLNDAVIETFNYTETLLPGTRMNHDFSAALDLSAFGTYDITVEIDFADDELPGNNVLTKSVKKLAQNDVSVTSTSATTVCGENIFVDVRVKNEGADLLETADIEVRVNGVLNEIIPWTGSIADRKSEVVEVLVSGLVPGNNDLSISLTNPNGVPDEILDNNESVSQINFDASFDQLTLTIEADDWPEETSWVLLDGNSTTVAEGGPYPNRDFDTITEFICVQPDQCLEFVFLDSFGDGICCGEGNGSYTLTDQEDVIIFASNGNFGREEITSFCVGIECNLTAEVDAVNETGAQKGSIVVEASGSYDYLYSIDGGSTFQVSPVFDGLSTGSYDVLVQSQGGNCSFEETIEIVFECTLSITIDETNNGDGTGDIEIIATGGDTYEYSIDGGVTFQTSNVFSNLESGMYEIQVRSNDGTCLETESITVDFVLGTSITQSVKIAPNPTTGIFTISVPGHDYIKGFLEVDILDLNGKVIQSHRFSRFDDSFKGTVSLYAYPDGIYFLKMLNAESDRITRILKQ